MTIGIKCSKCGLTQLIKENCESCGSRLDRPKGPLFSRSAPTPGPVLSPSTREGTGQIPSPYGKRDMGSRLRLSFHGTGGALLGIFLLNTLLTILTLGIYSFWGKVKVRSYIWSQTELEGDRFAYHGTGKELLTGNTKAIGIFALPLLLLNWVPRLIEPGATMEVITTILTYGFLMVVIPLAMAGARRYRLSRTSWRGIFFSFRGPTRDFVKLFLWRSFLTTLTLGLYYPFFETLRYGFMISHSYFGNQKFEFHGKGRDLFKPYLLALALTVPTVGLYWFWFWAQKQRYFWEHTSFEGIRFRSTVTGGRLLALYLGNLLLLIVTLGLAWPWIAVRKMHFTLTYLTLEGMLDPARIQQEAQPASATGEVLAGFMDTGFDLGQI